jgi:hypothetical protein
MRSMSAVSIALCRSGSRDGHDLLDAPGVTARSRTIDWSERPGASPRRSLPLLQSFPRVQPLGVADLTGGEHRGKLLEAMLNIGEHLLRLPEHARRVPFFSLDPPIHRRVVP